MAGLLVILAPVLAVVILSAFPYRYSPDGIAMLRVSFHHAGESIEGCHELTPAEREKFPEHMRLDKICSRERSPVRLALDLSGRRLLAKSYPPGGIKHDWPSAAFEEITVQPGRHRLVAELRDGDGPEDVVRFESDLVFAPGRVVVLDFDRVERRFEVLSTPAALL